MYVSRLIEQWDELIKYFQAVVSTFTVKESYMEALLVLLFVRLCATKVYRAKCHVPGAGCSKGD